MNFPEPLHPAVVHFPVVLLILGAPLAVAAVFLRRWHLPVIAAVVLSLGAVSAFVAVSTGEQDEDAAERAGQQAETVLDEHEEAAERTRSAAVVAAVVAVIAAGLFRFPRVARGVGVFAAVAACMAALGVAQTGHLGGRLVYEFGVGVKQGAVVKSSEGAAVEGKGRSGKKGDGHDKHDDDDD